MNYGKHYDDEGRYRGYTDSSGNMYDDTGKYKGRIDSNGNMYDDNGKYVGRIDSDGNSYDDEGRYTGRTDDYGNSYDDEGRYIGRTDNNKSNHNCQKSIKREVNEETISDGGGIVIIIAVVLFLSIGVLAISGGEILAELLAPPGIYVYLGIAGVSGLVGLAFKEEIYKKLCVTNYVFCMILWFAMLFAPQEDVVSSLGSIEKAVLNIVTIVIGFILMALFAVIMAGISCGIREGLRCVHEKHKLKYFIITVIVILGVAGVTNKEKLVDIGVLPVNYTGELSQEEQSYAEGERAYKQEDYLLAMGYFLKCSDYEDSEEFLEKSAHEYLKGLWEDTENDGQGYGIDTEKLFGWSYHIKGLLNIKEEIKREWEYRILDFITYEEDGEIVIKLQVDNNGEEGCLIFRNLSEEGFTCDNNGSFVRFE